ncbi:MAG: ECF transporter S component [Candidatus Bathyarchaeota archaeon]
MVDILKKNSATKTIALLSIFTAIYVVLRIIPTVPMIGGSGSFSLSDVIAPLYGLILGPYLGGLSVIIGSFLAMFGKPPVFLGLDFLPATVAAVSVGLLMKRKWIPVVGLNLALLLAFLLHPNTSIFVTVPLSNITIPLPFAWLHIVALLVLISPIGNKAVEWVSTLASAKVAIGIAFLFFIGTMMQHLMGNLLFETIFPVIYDVDVIALWPGVFFLYPIERAALVFFGTIVGTPLVRIFKKTFLL